MIMTNTRPNPYVGPRSFQINEKLYGRDREVRQLTDRLMAERIVLLHSPSGAGKTSLVQAGLIPVMHREGFHVHSVIRVNMERPEALLANQGTLNDVSKFNRYSFSVLLSLEEAYAEEERLPLPRLARLSIDEYLNFRAQEDKRDAPELLIFDQFEEVLTISPTDREAKNAFFNQIGAALKNKNRWALFVMRDDYVGAIEPYTRLVPTYFANTFRLDLLGELAAREAMQKPADQAGVIFTDPAARKLADDLRRIQVQGADGKVESALGLYVEPVQLQVVCYRLWNALSDSDSEISVADAAAIGDVDQSLAEYYALSVSQAAAETTIHESLIRRWFDEKLITPEGIRSQALMGADETDGLKNAAVRTLENAHIIRAEKRAGATWFELAHDRLISPVRKNNTEWFDANLSLLQRNAQAWVKNNRPRDGLLQGEQLTRAGREAKQRGEDQLEQYERDYLKACHEAQRVMTLTRGLAIGASIAFVIALIATWFAFDAAQKSADNELLAIEAQLIAISAQQTAVVAAQAADLQANVSRSGELGAQSQLIVDQSPSRSLLLALESVNLSKEKGLAISPASQQALRDALANNEGDPIPGSRDVTREVSFTANGRWMIAYSGINIQAWDTSAPWRDPFVIENVEQFFVSGRRLLVMRLREADVWDLSGDQPAAPLKTFRFYFEPADTALAPGVTLHVDQDGYLESSIAISPDGRWLAAHNMDDRWDIFDLDHPNEPYRSLPIVKQKLQIINFFSGVSFSPQGRWLVYEDQSLKAIYDLRNDLTEPAYLISKPDYSPINSQFSADDRWLALFPSFKLLDTSRGFQPLIDLPDLYPAYVTFSPDSRWISVAQTQTASLWRLNENLALDSSPALNIDIEFYSSGFAFSDNGRYAATVLPTSASDLRVWNLADDLPAQILSLPTSVFVSFSGETGIIYYDTALTQYAYLPFDKASDPYVLRLPADVSSLRVSRDGRYLAYLDSDGRMVLHDLSQIGASRYSQKVRTAFAYNLINITPDDRWAIAFSNNDRVPRVWNLDHMDRYAFDAVSRVVVNDRSEFAAQFAISPDAHWMIDQQGRLIDLTLAEPAPILTQYSAGAFDPSGQWYAGLQNAFVTGPNMLDGEYQNQIDLYALNDGSPRRIRSYAFTTHFMFGAPSEIHFSADSRWMISGAQGKIFVWDLQSSSANSDPAFTFEPERTAGGGGSGGDPDLRSDAGLAISPAGKWAAIGEGYLLSGTWVWDLQNPAKEPLTLTLDGGNYTTNLIFSPDERWLAAAYDHSVGVLWDLSAPDQNIPHYDLIGNRRLISALAISPDNHWLATGHGSDVYLWDLTSNDPSSAPQILQGHTMVVWSLVFSPDGSTLASASRDNTIRVWDMNAKNIMTSAVILNGHADAVYDLRFTQNGSTLASSSYDNTVRLWNMNVDELINLACKKAGRNFTKQEWALYFSEEAYRATCDQWALAQPETNIVSTPAARSNDPTATAMPPQEIDPFVIPSMTAIFTPSFTATPEAVVLTLEKNAFCRAGPSTDYRDITAYEAGKTLAVIGRNAAATWWYIPVPDTIAKCWVAASAGTITGDPLTLPIIDVAAPTSAPTSAPATISSPGTPAPTPTDCTTCPTPTP
jgi:WD40 repeat protein